MPFCSVRCGYCDFNTYTAEELGTGLLPGSSRATYAEAAIAEVRRARAALGDRDLPVSTVFFGGGTPTLLEPDDLTSVVAAIDAEFGLVAGAEVTTEANPDSVSAAGLARLREGGVNRVSFGMQSAVDHVLRVLDRTHDPLRVPDVVAWARAAGFDQVSLDLIYGTPGESLADWERSARRGARLRAGPRVGVLAHRRGGHRAGPPGAPRRAADARRGRPGRQVPARRPAARGRRPRLVRALELGPGPPGRHVGRCRHNLLYWTGGDWWGVGPGAHSHVAGARWWNVKHPAAYAERLAAGRSPAQDHEVLDDETRRVERVLLELRLRTGLPVDALDDAGLAAVPGLAADGLLEATEERLVLTPRGRLLADAVVRELLP